jgi:hypothetical protein
LNRAAAASGPLPSELLTAAACTNRLSNRSLAVFQIVFQVQASAASLGDFTNDNPRAARRAASRLLKGSRVKGRKLPRLKATEGVADAPSPSLIGGEKAIRKDRRLS